MPLIENGDDNYYDFYGLEERVSNVETQVSEVREDVSAVETQISEFMSLQSEQFSELMSAQSEQISEIVSVMSDNAVNTSYTVRNTETVFILLFVVIVLVGAVCGLMIANLIRK